jgi:hypothetical protein
MERSVVAGMAPWIRGAVLHIGSSLFPRCRGWKYLYHNYAGSGVYSHGANILGGGMLQRRSVFMQRTDDFMQWGFTEHGEALREYRSMGTNPVRKTNLPENKNTHSRISRFTALTKQQYSLPRPKQFDVTLPKGRCFGILLRISP